MGSISYEPLEKWSKSCQTWLSTPRKRVISWHHHRARSSLCTFTRQPIHPNPGHPTWESHRRYKIPCIRLHLSKSKVLQLNSGFREGAHELRIKFHWTKIEILEVFDTTYPLWHCILYAFIQTDPFLWSRFNDMSATHPLAKQAIIFH